MNIIGIGIVFTRGRGIDSLEQALCQGWRPPTCIKPFQPSDNSFPLYSIKSDTVSDKIVLGGIRRADRFSKLSVLAAWDALQDSVIPFDEKAISLGIIIATAFGPHVTTFRFLDDILDYGDSNVSPTIFSHSIHNAAASYVASVLNSHGPTLTITQFVFSFHQALILAEAWLSEGRCEYVLVGSVDECGKVMEYICSQKLHIAQDGKIKPFLFSSSPAAVPGEGSVFFLMKGGECQKRYCKIFDIVMNDNKEDENADIYILDTDGIQGDETWYYKTVGKSTYTAGYAPIFGSSMIGSSFHCAVAALMLRGQIRYACPVQDNPHGINLCTRTEKAEISHIHCIRYNCVHEKAIVKLIR